MVKANNHIRSSYLAPSSLVLGGAVWGGLEAILLLAGEDVGEYDALFWGVCSYALIGLLVGILLTPIVMLLARKYTLHDWNWSLLCSLFWLLGMTYIYDWSWWFASLCSISLHWFLLLLIRRTPLRVLTRPKGSSAMLTLLILVAAIFSVTPARTLERSAPKGNSEGAQMNILTVFVDGLQAEDLKRIPNIRNITERALDFKNAHTPSPYSAGAIATFLEGRVSHPPVF